MPFSLLKYGLSSDYPAQVDLPPPTELKPAYDVVIIGGGGHGLAIAYYLAKYHGITRVAVLEKAYLGGGNTARNTAVIRSNYLTPEGVRFYSASVKLFQELSNEFDFNIMYSERGPLTLAGQDANTLVQFPDEPNVLADLHPVAETLAVTAQNYNGSLDHDRDMALGKFSRFMPVGFYYRTFYKPKGVWKYWEPLIRRKAGARVMLVEQQPCLGGALWSMRASMWKASMARRCVGNWSRRWRPIRPSRCCARLPATAGSSTTTCR